MLENPKAEIYDRTTILLHWLVAGMILFMWLLAQIALQLPKGPVRLSLWSVHLITGLLLILVMLMRTGWRMTRGRRVAPASKGVLHVAAKVVQAMLYVLTFSVLVMGLLSVSSFPLFGQWTFPVVWTDPVNHAIRQWHGFVANVLISLAALHALAALGHHFIRRDRVLARMGIG
jgi:cytochrome b561